MRMAANPQSFKGRRHGPLGWLREQSYTGTARRKALMAYLFLLPTILGILIFTAGPVIVSLALSFFSWDVINDPVFIGFNNYRRLFHDQIVLTAFVNTGIFVVLAVSLQVLVGLLLAMRMQQRMPRWLRYVFRSAFFIPLLTSGATISVVMAYMFNQEFGTINYYLGLFGISAIPWLNDAKWAMITVVLTYVWQQLGFTFLVFTGGLKSISREILDAADVDGITGWRRAWYITIPLLSPSILFATVIGVIGALQVFTEPTVLTQGGPGDATRTAVMIIYEAAFQYLQVGYGSTVAVLLFVVILGVTGVQFWSSRRWVFYQ
ncbi:MAG TPA: sugar ABC transporter permease [Chloroflexota bacterium]|nr:sugar ABC transporter permease [Chloroflexota bacterium]